ncbi:MAG: hypothetical protein ACREB3_11065, partial [Burkholderiales bacterium]
MASIIEKPLLNIGVSPNLERYEEACNSFSWLRARSLVDGLPAGGLNIAHEAVDRHARGALKDKLAIRWLGKDGTVVDFSYERLGACEIRPPAARDHRADVLWHRGRDLQ